MSKHTEAQRLADKIENRPDNAIIYGDQAAAELRRLDAVNAQLLEALLRLQRRGWLNDHPCAGDDGNRDLAFARAAIAATGNAP